MLEKDNRIKSVDILKIENYTANTFQDNVTTEEPFLLNVENVNTFKLLSSPRDLNNLAVGYLFSENIIENYSDIISIKINEKIIFVQIKNPESALIKFNTKKNFNYSESDIIKNITKFKHISVLLEPYFFLPSPDDVRKLQCCKLYLIQN